MPRVRSAELDALTTTPASFAYPPLQQVATGEAFTSPTGGGGGGRVLLRERGKWAHRQWLSGDWWRPAHIPTVPDDVTIFGHDWHQYRTDAAEVRDTESSWTVVAFASVNYLDIAKVWYARLAELGYTEHKLLAMDYESYMALAAAGMRVESHVPPLTEPVEPHEPVPRWGRGLWKLWRYRMLYLLGRLKGGENIFLVDVDTMWSRYVPLTALFDGDERSRNTDVFASQGTVFPSDVHERWGFVACMGTIAFRATKNSQELLRQMLHSCKSHSCDDQFSLNHAQMDTFAVVWDRDTGFGKGKNGIKVRMWPKSFVHRDREEKLVVNSSGLGEGSRGSCLGQLNEAVDAAVTGAEVNYTVPFIAAPVIDKAGKSKMDVFNRFQSFCYSIRDEDKLAPGGDVLPELPRRVGVNHPSEGDVRSSRSRAAQRATRLSTRSTRTTTKV